MRTLFFLLLACTSANATNLGDVPYNAHLSDTCGKVSFLGTTITAWCFDKNDIPHKSAIDVRRCRNFGVDLQASRLVCHR